MADTIQNTAASANSRAPRNQLIVKPRANGPLCTLLFARYSADKTTALQLVIADTGERWGTATVCLYPPNNPSPGENGVWLKGWSENEGMPEALQDAGVLTLTDRCVPCGYAVAEHATLSKAAVAEMQEQMEMHPERFGLKAVRP